MPGKFEYGFRDELSKIAAAAGLAAHAGKALTVAKAFAGKHPMIAGGAIGFLLSKLGII